MHGGIAQPTTNGTAGATLVRYPMANGESISTIHIWQTTKSSRRSVTLIAWSPEQSLKRPEPTEAPPADAQAGQIHERRHSAVGFIRLESSRPDLLQRLQQQQQQQQPQQHQQTQQQPLQQQQQQQNEPETATLASEQIPQDPVDEEECTYMVVGTRDRRLQWNPCKGRLLLLQLANSDPGMSSFFPKHHAMRLHQIDCLYAVSAQPRTMK